MQKTKAEESRTAQNRGEKKTKLKLAPLQLSDLPPMASSSQRHEVRDQRLNRANGATGGRGMGNGERQQIAGSLVQKVAKVKSCEQSFNFTAFN